ncbi:MAG: DNA replication/repair protein RecF [Gammaproteobacteria bacterium]|nr:DNA replication/repair protein RecF [Gammaproteobacteria bacterium]
MVSAGKVSRQPISEIRLEAFRCFDSAVLAPGPQLNVIAGSNASGKTSLLEAIFVLGRGSSFRSSKPDAAIQFGAEQFTVFGSLRESEASRVGVAVSRTAGLSVRIDGRSANRAELVRSLPVQVLEPASHELIAGPPSVRRQFLDWSVFHVEHVFLEAWQQYRRALQQRNAALRQHSAAPAWAWDSTLSSTGLLVDECRRRLVARMAGAVRQAGNNLLEADIELRYLSGWAEGTELAAALLAARDRDQQLGSTSVGPHRADLVVTVRERRARDTVSRGQEKLVVAALTLGQIEVVAEAVGRPVVLLVDEPGADLDRHHLRKLLASVLAAPVQAFVTSLEPGLLEIPESGRLFHVEQGSVRPLLY